MYNILKSHITLFANWLLMFSLQMVQPAHLEDRRRDAVKISKPH